jgi:TonB-linked SusC/RagA family outer membrane protein
MKKSSIYYLMVFLLLFMSSTNVLAQNSTVHGVVKDQTGEPVIGAKVAVRGSTSATVTDVDGNFTLSVPAKAELVVSYIGYDNAQVPVAGKSFVEVTMTEDNQLLNEVVVVGYGTMKKRDLTGAIGSLAAKDMENTPVANIGQAIQGKIAGLQVIDSGTPGDNVSIKVRGLGSINNCDPLVVIDGVPTDLGINAINTADVERLDVLKDASATAIYGSRGANGVIMITTKKGKEGKGRLSFAANLSVQNATKTPELLNASQYAALSNDMMVNSGNAANPEWVDPTTLGAGTNWVDEMFRTGYLQNYTVSYQGGTETSHYYVSGGFLDQSGIVRSVNYRRFTFQENSDAQVLKWLKMSNNITFSADKKEHGSYSISDTYHALPVFTVKDETGDWSGPTGNSLWYGTVRNPVGPTTTDKSITNGYNMLGNITAEVSFTKWLKFKSTFGADIKIWFNDEYYPKYDWKPIATEESGRYQASNKSFTYLWDNYFIFDHTFAGKHHVGVMAGSSAQWNDYSYLNAKKTVFEFESVHEMDNGQKMYSIGGNETEWALLSYMARANYEYDNKYLLTATIRRDGSSRFVGDKRWGTFPSVSGAWRISEETWFPKNEYVSDLKLRVGYGATGSQASVGNYSYLASYVPHVYSFGYDGKEQASLISETLSNSNIHWEKVAQTNIGFDASLLNSRAFVSFDYYIKNTSDMLVKASIPITSGFSSNSTTYTNAGKVRNTGFEISLNTINLKGELGWETGIVYTFNKNKIKSLNSDVPYYINQINNSYVTMLANNYPINVFYGYVTDGIFQNEQEVENHAIQGGAEAGDIRFKDLNNDGVINDEDRTVLGNPNPTHMFSMTNTLTYKGFEFSFYLQGVAGNKIFNANKIDLTGMAAAYNQMTDVLDRWQGEGTSNTMPRAVYGDPNGNNRVSDRFVEKGDYLRLKNVSLSYNFPKQWLNVLTIEAAKLTVSCENVVTLTSYSGFDPEVGFNGIDLSNYPISRTFNVGINFNF